MTSNEFRALVNKYAILIFIGYALNFVTITVVQRLIPGSNNHDVSFIGILSSSTWLIQFVINIIAAILISKDLKRHNIKNNLIVAMTVMFSLIGITMFFISANSEMKMPAPNKS
jgi:protein-S-isoprenylcysteine O-methyltransferase Ste14